MIIDGKALAAERAASLKLKVQSLEKKPKLAIVLVGDDEASKIHVNLKVKKAQELGIEVEVRRDLNTNADGIIVQLPGGENLIEQIPLEKDIDGLRGGSPFLPATVKGILEMLKQVQHDTQGTFVIVGQGKLVGKPLADYLERSGKNVIRCDVNTKNLKEETLKGDILVVATGKEKLITADMVKPGATVIDCGSPKPEVDFEHVKNIAGAITPVPGGVGPMTVISLLENLVEAVKI
ncbi:bifunctional 5,10-methylenetetrahydrofolate dehydrogenase/5,10-methenyltetrahydrofolate cyclohydrolase [Candidatus Microgenomates bacterium]|nr:bifunctional 5,10-methylenetetrahydrofolate dehydrogenase/5,10-methenyltetrahydrofolate cyclohydrolase [Candidatus Microgenomates bacterium]